MEIQQSQLQGTSPQPFEGHRVGERQVAPAGSQGSVSDLETKLGQRLVTADDGSPGEPVPETDPNGGVLSTGEKQILGLLFDDQEGDSMRLYGPQSAKPVVLGNFVDLRG